LADAIHILDGKAMGEGPRPQEKLVIIFIALFCVCDKNVKKRRERRQNREWARCQEAGIFVIIFIAILFGCDKTRAASGSQAEEKELARCSETKIKHQK
jgi:hypothetical protein